MVYHNICAKHLSCTDGQRERHGSSHIFHGNDTSGSHKGVCKGGLACEKHAAQMVRNRARRDSFKESAIRDGLAKTIEHFGGSKLVVRLSCSRWAEQYCLQRWPVLTPISLQP